MSVGVKDQLKGFSRAMVESLPALEPASVIDPVVGRHQPVASRSWRLWAAVASLAVIAILAVPMLLLDREPPSGSTVPTMPVTTTAAPATTTTAGHPITIPGSALPSQSVADAARDGVLTEVAAIPLQHRVTRLAELETEEGLWVMSRVSPDYITENPVLYPLNQYGEILLLDDEGRIRRAFPMPEAYATWMTVEGDYLYFGRTGDGGLPHSTLGRIDRSSFDWIVVMFATGHVEVEWPPTWRTWPDNWHFAAFDQVDRYLAVVGFASQGATGTPVTAWVGDVVVDVRGAEALIDETVGG